VFISDAPIRDNARHLFYPPIRDKAHNTISVHLGCICGEQDAPALPCRFSAEDQREAARLREEAGAPSKISLASALRPLSFPFGLEAQSPCLCRLNKSSSHPCFGCVPDSPRGMRKLPEPKTTIVRLFRDPYLGPSIRSFVILILSPRCDPCLYVLRWPLCTSRTRAAKRQLHSSRLWVGLGFTCGIMRAHPREVDETSTPSTRVPCREDTVLEKNMQNEALSHPARLADRQPPAYLAMRAAFPRRVFSPPFSSLRRAQGMPGHVVHAMS